MNLISSIYNKILDVKLPVMLLHLSWNEIFNCFVPFKGIFAVTLLIIKIHAEKKYSENLIQWKVLPFGEMYPASLKVNIDYYLSPRI